MPRAPAPHLALSTAVALALSLAVSTPARADVREDVFAVSGTFDLGLFGRLSLPDEVRPKIAPRVGGALRVEGLFATHFAVGVEGAVAWTSYVGSEPLGEAAFAIVDSNGFARFRLPLDGGDAEYYLIVGGGASWLPYDDTDPAALGQAVGVGSTVGWNVFGRLGVRAELVDGVGMLLEVGYRRRQIDAALVASDAGGARYDYTADQLSIVLGWYGGL